MTLVRFMREAFNAARLRHPNVVQVYDVGNQDGLYFLVIDLVNGRSLRDLLVPGSPLPLERAARLLEQLALALDAATPRTSRAAACPARRSRATVGSAASGCGSPEARR